uniref:NADPH--hemoprotein reductase n=1 Tax=Ciona savignyi TaxID=51511 RepID=H2YK30_CIOSA
QGRNIAILYGSQTGTGEEFANRLAKDAQRYGMKALVLDPEECNADDLPQLIDIPNSLVLMCMATYGEGDPTDNAQDFHDWLKQGDTMLTGLRYAVFGLGNKTYEHYNSMGKFVDKRFEELGAERVYELGLGDDDTNIEEDFVTWKEGLWPAVCQRFGLEASMEDGSFRAYSFTKYEDGDLDPKTIYTGEVARLHSYDNQRPPYDAKNPYLAPIQVNRELHNGGDRSSAPTNTGNPLRNCTKSGWWTPDEPSSPSLPTSPPANPPSTIFVSCCLDSRPATTPLPAPQGNFTLFLLAHSLYIHLHNKCDIKQVISSTNRLSVLRIAKKRKPVLRAIRALEVFSGKNSNMKYSSGGRTPQHITIPIITPHILPLKPLTSQAHPNSIHICAVVVKYETKAGYTNLGVATNWLSTKTPGGEPPARAPIYVRKSQFRLPFKVSHPVVMIGPGTGAPFIGFIQDRAYHKEAGKDVGKTILYFGCRKRSEDFIYGDQLDEWWSVLTELNLAFSRDGEKKVYVQHLIAENRDSLWKVIEGHGHIYVCGDARHMARDVHDAIVSIVEEKAGKTHQQAVDFVKGLMNKGRYSADVWS